MVSGQWSVNQQSSISNQQSSNPQSLIPNPFVIRTPTATVTDLGTEFGVEVSKEGDTETHVFVGEVQIATRQRPRQRRRADAGDPGRPVRACRDATRDVCA